MSTDDNEFKCRWESDRNFVRAIHSDGDEHLMTWDGKQLGPDWMTPLAGLIPVADENRSMTEAQGHSGAARKAAEKFIASTMGLSSP
jgi:hypothetical protein